MLSPFAKKPSVASSPSASPKPGTGNENLIKDVNLDAFMVDVIDASRTRPVIVDFWAPWCGPCKQLGPILEKLVQSYKGAMTLAKVDIDQNQEIAVQMGVQSIPAVFAFFQGRPIDGFMGAQTEAQIKAFLERIVKTTGATSDEGLSVDSALKQAAEFLETKHIAEAQSIYAEIFAHDPANAIAYAGLMRCLIEAGDMAAAKDMLAKAPTAIAANKALDSVRATIELADQAAAKGSYADIKIKVDQNPADHQGRFDLALAYYAAGQKEQAVDELLEIIRRQRSWNEDAARKQLVKFFEAFGPTDPLTISARRRLSSILFS